MTEEELIKKDYKERASKAGKARWANIPPEERKKQMKEFKDADRVVSRRFPKGYRTAGTAFAGGIGIEKATQKAKKRKMKTKPLKRINTK